MDRLRIGNTRLTHTFLMTKEHPPICTIRGTHLTVKHMLTECLKYENLRKENDLPKQLFEILRPG